MRKLSTTALAVIAGAAVVVVAAVVTVIVLVAGGGGADGAGSAAPTAGCTEVATEELYVQHAYDCPDGTRVLTFADSSARDDFLKVAEHFGAVTVERGATWARTRS
jgi:hypothetical protein